MPAQTWNDLFAFLQQLMNDNASLFESMGLRMFKAFSVIMIAWFGIKSALASASGGHGAGFHFDQFAKLLMTIAFGLAMITYYTHPIPGFGTSFHQLITDQGLYMANRINQATVEKLSQRMSGLYFGLEQPGISIVVNAMEFVRYLILAVALALSQAAVFAVIAFGYVASSIAVLVGPMFVPFFIVPQMEWLFWGWLKSLIQYSFYPVVANAYVLVFGNLLIRFADSHPPPYDGATMLLLFYPLLALLIAFTYGIVKIPSLVNSLFTGSSGQSALPR
jgi:type IV secretory pathway VirB6-like protein